MCLVRLQIAFDMFMSFQDNKIWQLDILDLQNVFTNTKYSVILI